MNKSTGLVMFIFGAAIGAVVACRFAKSKYEAISQEEIESVKAAYSKRADECKAKENSNKEYADIICQEGYANKTVKTEPMFFGENADEKYSELLPYVISPEEFSENFDYDTIDITYYADGVLTDENNERLEDIKNTVGNDAVNHFGEYSNDCVYVRNDRLKCDYEILRDTRKYSDVLKSKSNRMGVNSDDGK